MWPQCRLTTRRSQVWIPVRFVFFQVLQVPPTVQRVDQRLKDNGSMARWMANKSSMFFKQASFCDEWSTSLPFSLNYKYCFCVKYTYLLFINVIYKWIIGWIFHRWNSEVQEQSRESDISWGSWPGVWMHLCWAAFELFSKTLLSDVTHVPQTVPCVYSWAQHYEWLCKVSPKVCIVIPTRSIYCAWKQGQEKTASSWTEIRKALGGNQEEAVMAGLQVWPFGGLDNQTELHFFHLAWHHIRISQLLSEGQRVVIPIIQLGAMWSSASVSST